MCILTWDGAISRGEEAASLIEASLSSFETKLDAILAAYGIAPASQATEEPEMDEAGKAGGERKAAAANGEKKS